jgi:hypothetical protein
LDRVSDPHGRLWRINRYFLEKRIVFVIIGSAVDKCERLERVGINAHAIK